MKTKILLFFTLSLLFNNSLDAQWMSRGDTGLADGKFVIALDAVDAQTAWALPWNTDFSPDNSIIKTTDNGETWEVFNPTIINPDHIPVVLCALDEMTAWVSAYNLDIVANGNIYKTSDGGATWIIQDSAFGEYAPLGIYFWNENEGLAFGNNGPNYLNNLLQVYTTTDGGENWIQNDMALLGAGEVQLSSSGNNTFEVNGDKIYIGTNLGNILISEDRGLTWSKVSGQMNLRQVTSVAFKDNMNGVFISTINAGNSLVDNRCSITDDGGLTWTEVPIPSSPSVSALEYVPGTDNTYFAITGISNTQKSFYSTDGGKNWNITNTPRFRAIDFVDENTAWGGTYSTSLGSEMRRLTSSFANDHYNVKTIIGSGREGDKLNSNPLKSSLWNPQQTLTDTEGNLYIADDYSNKIRMLKTNGTLIDFAGGGTELTGPVEEVSLGRMNSMAFGPDGSLYIADFSPYIKRIDWDSGEPMLSIYAGSGEIGSENGSLLDATFITPTRLVFDSQGNLFVADNCRIRKITPEGIVSDFAGDEGCFSTDGTGQDAGFDFIWGMSIDTFDNIFVADIISHIIRKVTPTAVVSTVAGTGAFGNSDGIASNASFAFPEDVLAMPDGSLLVAGGLNGAIRKVSTDDVVSTVCGISEIGISFYITQGDDEDGDGEFIDMGRTRALSLKPGGNVYASSWDNDIIREIEIGAPSFPLIVREAGWGRTYYQENLTHFEPKTFSTMVENISEYDIANVSFKTTIKQGFSTIYSEETEPVLVNAGEVAMMTINEVFIPADTGSYEVTITLKTGTNEVFYNRTDEIRVNSQVLRKDDNHSYIGYNHTTLLSGAATASHGLAFDLTVEDSLYFLEVPVTYSGSGELGFSFYKSDETGENWELLSIASETFDTTSSNILRPVFDEPLYLSPGRYLATVDFTGESEAVFIGLDNNVKSYDWYFSNPSTDWTTISDVFGVSSGLGIPMIGLGLSSNIGMVSNLSPLNSTDFDVNVFPNPFTDQLSIDADEKRLTEASICDATGIVLKKQKMDASSSYTLFLSDLPAGVYFLTVQSEEGQLTKRVVKY